MATKITKEFCIYRLSEREYGDDEKLLWVLNEHAAQKWEVIAFESHRIIFGRTLFHM